MYCRTQVWNVNYNPKNPDSNCSAPKGSFATRVKQEAAQASQGWTTHDLGVQYVSGGAVVGCSMDSQGRRDRSADLVTETVMQVQMQM